MDAKVTGASRLRQTLRKAASLAVLTCPLLASGSFGWCGPANGCAANYGLQSGNTDSVSCSYRAGGPGQYTAVILGAIAYEITVNGEAVAGGGETGSGSIPSTAGDEVSVVIHCTDGYCLHLVGAAVAASDR